MKILIPHECGNHCRFFESGYVEDCWYSDNPYCHLYSKTIAKLFDDDIHEGCSVSEEDHFSVKKPKFCTAKKIILE